jgi:hypothetical protein
MNNKTLKQELGDYCDFCENYHLNVNNIKIDNELYCKRCFITLYQTNGYYIETSEVDQ